MILESGLCCFGIIAAIAILAIIYLFTIYNRLVTLRNNIDKAWANIDVMLKQRYDLVPNLVQAVQGYMKHEKQVFEDIAALRASFMGAGGPAEKAKANDALSGALKTIFAVSENYPDLKASTNFLELQKQLTVLENQIADRREFYNDSVLLYNNRIKSVPDTIIASAFGFKEKEYFKAGEEEQKAVQVKMEEQPPAPQPTGPQPTTQVAKQEEPKPQSPKKQNPKTKPK